MNVMKEKLLHHIIKSDELCDRVRVPDGIHQRKNPVNMYLLAELWQI